MIAPDGYQAERYSIAAVPDDHWLNWFSDMNTNGVTLAWRNDDSWAVIRGRFMDGGMVWHATDGWVYEPSPSNRTDEFKRDTRFPLAEAADIGRVRAALLLAELEQRHADDPRLAQHRLAWIAAHPDPAEPHRHVPSIRGLPGSNCKLCGDGFMAGIHRGFGW